MRCVWVVMLLAAAVATGQERDRRTWAERLGYPPGRRVLILHADDIGMCYEANHAAKDLLGSGAIQSVSVMVPCPWFSEFADWAKRNPGHCVGLHLTLNAEWRWYRWPPVAGAARVPGLVDEDGMLWRDVAHVLARARPAEVEEEIRAQVRRALRHGLRPTHLDTHMGTLYARPAFTEAYLKVAREFGLPAMTVEPTRRVAREMTRRGMPLHPRLLRILREWPGPKLDMLYAVPNAKSYEEKVRKLFDLVRGLEPGITELYFHPSVETEGLRRITNSWRQRAWEARMWKDPRVRTFFAEQDVVFTSWKEMQERFAARYPEAAAPRTGVGRKDEKDKKE